MKVVRRDAWVSALLLIVIFLAITPASLVSTAAVTVSLTFTGATPTTRTATVSGSDVLVNVPGSPIPMGQSFVITFHIDHGCLGMAEVDVYQTPVTSSSLRVWESEKTVGGDCAPMNGGQAPTPSIDSSFTVPAGVISTSGSFIAKVTWHQYAHTYSTYNVPPAEGLGEYHFSVYSPSLGQATAITTAKTLPSRSFIFTFHSWTGTPIVSTTVTVSHTHTRWTDPSPPYPWPPPGYYPPPGGSCDPNNPYSTCWDPQCAPQCGYQAIVTQSGTTMVASVVTSVVTASPSIVMVTQTQPQSSLVTQPQPPDYTLIGIAIIAAVAVGALLMMRRRKASSATPTQSGQASPPAQLQSSANITRT